MAKATSRPSRLSWMLPSFSVLVVVALYLFMALSAEDDFFISALFIAPALVLVSIVLILYAIIPRGRGKRLTLLSTVTALWLASVCMFYFDAKYGQTIRTAGRWLIWSRDYKAEVLAQPPPPSGNFRHIEWDGWGFAPSGETTVYLVYDPLDSLFAAAKSGRAGTFKGIPCAVLEVNRLEKKWYTVVFYTDEDWNHCD